MRGRTEYADAFFPLVLLNLSQAQNLTNSFQVVFMAGVMLMVTVLLLSAHAQRLGFRAHNLPFVSVQSAVRSGHACRDL